LKEKDEDREGLLGTRKVAHTLSTMGQKRRNIKREERKKEGFLS